MPDLMHERSDIRVGGAPFERISVYYPRGVRTGGPEALHQLVDSLRKQGHVAYLVPIPGTECNQRVAEYRDYDAPESMESSDRRCDAIVFPEMWAGGFIGLGAARRFCWWLSVDNSAFFAAERMWANRHIMKLDVSRRALLRARVAEVVKRSTNSRQLRNVTHLAQSHYAKEFLLERLGIHSKILSDYVALELLPRAGLPSTPPAISYNSAKGGANVAAVQERMAKELRWMPIGGMSRKQVLSSLAASDVYLDLGHQPGKDRLPREAALLGAVSLVLRVGAGANERDTRIPPQHKIDPRGDLVAHACEALTRVLDDLPRNLLLQEDFRTQVRREREDFHAEVRSVFESDDS